MTTPTLTDLRNLVRTQTQTLPTELPDTTIDGYLYEAFTRTITAENDWPFYESEWDLELTAGLTNIPLPGDVDANRIESLLDVENERLRLTEIEFNEAERLFFGTQTRTAVPHSYSLWNGYIHLWPQIKYGDTRKFYMRGYRMPQDWIAQGPAAVPDCDPRLVRALVHYAVALAYMQQEDEFLEARYMERWQRDFESARRNIMEPAHQDPLIMGPKYTTRIGHTHRRPVTVINLP